MTSFSIPTILSQTTGSKLTHSLMATTPEQTPTRLSDTPGQLKRTLQETRIRIDGERSVQRGITICKMIRQRSHGLLVEHSWVFDIFTGSQCFHAWASCLMSNVQGRTISLGGGGVWFFQVTNFFLRNYTTKAFSNKIQRQFFISSLQNCKLTLGQSIFFTLKDSKNYFPVSSATNFLTSPHNGKF